MKSKELRYAIYKCLSYAKVFDYPLTKQEIKHWLVFNSVQNYNPENLKINDNFEILKILESDPAISNKEGYYLLNNQKQNPHWLNQQIQLRKQKEQFSIKKLQIAKKVSKWLRLIPSIEMVAITGSLAVKQAQKNDDIDLMIISSSGTLWTTRFMYLLILQLLRVRRKPNLNHKNIDYWLKINNKICPNLLIDKDYLTQPENKQDIYYAHEILQARLLWDRHAVYEKFLNHNIWIANILPFAWKSKQNEIKQLSSGKERLWLKLILMTIYAMIRAVEPLMRVSQLWYMSSRRTGETVTPYRAQFYPIDFHKRVIKKYRNELKKLNID